MADVRNIQLGVCTVKRAGTDLGHSIGGVVINYKPKFHDVKVDQYGDTLAQQFLVGEELGAKFSLAEFVLSNLLVAISQGTQLNDDSITIGSNAGKKQSDKAALWVFHPIANSATNYNDDWSIYRGVVVSDLEIEHTNEGEKKIPIEVTGLVDEGRSDGNLLGFFGDSIS